jgi:hypothetical protein
MDQEMLKRRLAEAEGHIATGDKNIACQGDLIAQLERDGPRYSVRNNLLT